MEAQILLSPSLEAKIKNHFEDFSAKDEKTNTKEKPAAREREMTEETRGVQQREKKPETHGIEFDTHEDAFV